MRFDELIEGVKSSALDTVHRPVEPPVLKGTSGVVHVFSLLLVADGARFCGFDVYENVGEIEVLKSRIKAYDTGASCHIVASTGIDPAAGELARIYGISILIKEDIERTPLPAQKGSQSGGLILRSRMQTNVQTLLAF